MLEEAGDIVNRCADDKHDKLTSDVTDYSRLLAVLVQTTDGHVAGGGHEHCQPYCTGVRDHPERPDIGSVHRHDVLVSVRQEGVVDAGEGVESEGDDEKDGVDDGKREEEGDGSSVG